MAAWLERLQTASEQRLPALTRRLRAEHLPIELDRRRIYILPTGFGIGFAVLLLVMLTGALNYANNSALLLTCMLGAACATSMLLAFRTLDGLRLEHIRAGHACAGEPIELTLCFASDHACEAVRIDMERTTLAFALGASGHHELKLTLSTTRRGWQPLPRMRLWSSWPLGMFRAWSWLHPAQSVLVWPRPEAAGPSPYVQADDARDTRRRPGEEPAALRDYRAGDSPRRIAWKASARHHDLLVKEYEQLRLRAAWQLDWRQLPGLDREARIARLARWLGEAQAQQRNFSLWLPGNVIGAGSGPRHYAHCMNALAQLP